MKLSALVESVQAVDEEIMITKNGYPAAVLVSSDEFEGWKETPLCENDTDLLAEIRQGLVALKEEKTALYTLEELFD